MRSTTILNLCISRIVQPTYIFLKRVIPPHPTLMASQPPPDLTEFETREISDFCYCNNPSGAQQCLAASK